MRRARIDRRAQSGVSFVFMLFVMIAFVGVIVAGRVLSRWSDTATSQAQTNASLKKVAVALEQYAATATRLPCPADPTLDTGLEVPGGTSYSCTIDTGTVPWQTIGLRRDDSFDGWGWKISYRVYDAPGGSLVQTGNASMVLCDTVQASPTMPTTGPSGGACQPTKDTTPANYLAGKGLKLYDFSSTARNDVAYVLISHGPTGYGAYTTSGVQKPMPKGNELSNTYATGPFFSKAWSDPTVGVQSSAHFDDILLYRTVSDLIKNANLSARDWAEASVISDVQLNPTTLGRTGPNLGTSTASAVVAGSAPVTLTASGNSGNNLTLVNDGGTYGAGISSFGGIFTSLTNALGIAESVNVGFQRPAQQFAVTLDNFGTGGGGAEQAQLTFRRLGVKIASTVIAGCQPDGSGVLARFSVNVATATSVAFDSVDIAPVNSSGGGWSSFFISEVAACDAGTTCITALGNTCAAPSVVAIPAAVTTANKFLLPTGGPSPSAAPVKVTLAYNNIGSVAASNVTVSDVIPSGMNYVRGSGLWSQSGFNALTDASDGVEQSGIDYRYDAVSGTVSAIVSSVPAGSSGAVTFQVNIASGLSPGSINNLASFSSSTQTASNTNTASYFVPYPLNAAKSFSPASGPSPSITPVTVTLTYANSAAAAMTNVTLTDPLPTGLTYVSGSGRWSGAGTTALTDAADGVEPTGINYSFSSNTVTAVIPSVATGAFGSVTFQVNVNSGLSSGSAIANQATFSSSTQSATTTNSATYAVQ